MYGNPKASGVVSRAPPMKPAISIGLLLLLASCAAPVKQSGTPSRTAHLQHHETLRPKVVTVPRGSTESDRYAQRANVLRGLRNYGEVELPPPIASINAPARRYQP